MHENVCGGLQTSFCLGKTSFFLLSFIQVSHNLNVQFFFCSLVDKYFHLFPLYSSSLHLKKKKKHSIHEFLFFCISIKSQITAYKIDIRCVYKPKQEKKKTTTKS